jgi:thioredoxin
MRIIKSNQVVSKDNFNKLVLENSNIALVKCKTEWSGSCRLVAPMFKELAIMYHNQINFFTLDIDDNKSVVEKYGVHELPHFLFFKKGELVDQVIGTAPKSVLEQKLIQLITNN